MFQWGCLAEGLHLAPAHPPYRGSWLTASFMRPSFPGRPGTPATSRPAVGVISQWRSPRQLVSHIGDVSIFTAERRRFQAP